MVNLSLVKCKDIEHAVNAAKYVGGLVVIGVDGSASWLDTDTVPAEILLTNDVAAVCTASEARIGYLLSDKTEAEATDIDMKLVLMIELIAKRAHALPVNVSARFMKHALSELMFKYKWLAAKDEVFRELYETVSKWRTENQHQITEKNQAIVKRALSDVEKETVEALTDEAALIRFMSEFANVIVVVD
jgi:hypothetical protein